MVFWTLAEPHGDGGEDFEELFAAAVLAAFFIVGDEAGFIAGADLAEFDAGVEFVGEVADHVAEIDALLGGEIEEDAFAAEEGAQTSMVIFMGRWWRATRSRAMSTCLRRFSSSLFCSARSWAVAGAEGCGRIR